MANGNDYTAQGNNEMMNQMQNMQNSGTRPEPTPNPEDQDTYAEILQSNIGAYVLVQFLIGSTSIVEKEGYLYASGVNFVTIYEPLDDRYVVCDLYSVKFVTIYNTPPIGNTFRTTNAMSANRNTQNGRYTNGGYTQNRR